MRTQSKFFRFLTALMMVLIITLSGGVRVEAANTLANLPLFLTQGSTPLVMLDLSRDQQLYFKAYDDYSDLDSKLPGGDAALETTYKHTVDYYGYFDSYKCYTYSASNSRFEPALINTDKYCNVSTTGQWSGNFLNWSTMTRMDVVRKILYGGFRSADTATGTTLERVFLPNDAHSFAKYYNGADISRLTPYTGIGTGSSQSDGITICNTTVDSTNSLLSQNVTAAPLMRVAKGNYSLWSSNERWQCRWSGEKSASNGNDSSKSGINAASSNPDKSSNGLQYSSIGPDLSVRVQVCVSQALLGAEKCKAYPSTNVTYPTGVLKPIGLLQTYGDSGQIYYGLLTGSYGANTSGGVLRKNIGSMSSEVNVSTDGTFVAPLSTGGILQTLNALRIYGYNYGDGTYFGITGSDNCSWGLNTFSNGNCSNWGNPQSEMYLESLRYLAGKTATPTFNANDSARFANLKTAVWSAPISSSNYCAPLSIIQFNASTSSYDGDELGGASDIGMSGASALSTLTDLIGAGEGITGSSVFVGENGTNNNQVCTPKAVSNLSKLLGTCPDAPRLRGSYQIAGLSYYAHNVGLQASASYPNQKVRTYGVALSPATAKVIVPVPGSTTGQTISILPACRNSTVGGNCAIVDFKIVSQTSSGTANSGKLYVNWEDSEQGGDYDQDMWGIISYQVTSSNVTVTTQVIAQSTPNLMGFGYVIGGTTSDGFNVHSGINGFNYTASVASGNTTCNNCNSGDSAKTNTYSVGVSSAKNLQQPLYYAAKWGGFNDGNSNSIPDQSSEWDSNNDGLPDTYYYATNPAQLEASLSQALQQVSQDIGSSSAVATNSTHLDLGTIVFQAKFNAKDWSGQLLAYPLTTTGAFGNAKWDAGASGNIPAATSRKLVTYNPTTGSGVDLQWANLTVAEQAALQLSPSETTNVNAQARLAWLRGDQSQEQPSGIFRKRTSLLGDIVNSDPVYSGGDDFGYASLPAAVPGRSSYAAYVATKRARTPVVMVGSNDGFLHGFNANTGAELFAYMPSKVLNTAIALTRPDYGGAINPHQYFVDGSLFVDDAYFGGAWHTVLFGAMGGGGRAVFALDISNPTGFSASNVLFELTDQEAGSLGTLVNNEIGYVLGQPITGLMADGSWAAVFGNGYNSVNGKASLFIVDLSNKANTKVVATNAGPNNGLSGPELYVDGNGVSSFAYAGDLLGNMWKFDLSSTSASSWNIPFSSAGNPIPLFIARGPSGEVQPITASPTLGVNTAASNQTMVYFGTGQYFAIGDNAVPSTPPVQSFYGIRDNGSAITTINRSALFQKSITQQTSTSRTVAEGSSVNWTATRGWYLDFIQPNGTKTGERVISKPLLVYDRLLFTTFIPSQVACTFGGSGWLMDVGGVDVNSTFRVIGGSGTYLSVAVVKTPSFIESGENVYLPASNLRGDNPNIKGKSKSYPFSSHRMSWRQLR